MKLQSTVYVDLGLVEAAAGDPPTAGMSHRKRKQTAAKSRRELRKEQRQQKKQRIDQYHRRKGQHEEGRTVGMSRAPSSNSNHRKIHEETAKTLKNHEQSQSWHFHKSTATTTKTKVKEQDAERYRRQLRKLAEHDPQLYQQLEQDRLVQPASTLLGKQDGTGALHFPEEEDDADDRRMRMYAKKLGLKSTNKIGDAFRKDGLDFLLEPLDEGKAKQGDEEDSSQGEEELDEFERGLMGEESTDSEEETNQDDVDESFSEEEEEDFDSEEDVYSGDEEMADEEFTEDDGSEQDSAEEDNSNAEDDEAHSDDEEIYSSDEMKTRSGSTSETSASDDSSHNTPPKDTDNTNKYVPPHLRRQQLKPKEKSEAYLRLQRQLQGHLNRLAETNIETVFTVLEGFFASNSRHDVTEILTDLVVQTVTNQAHLLESFVTCYACLIALVVNVVGSDVGANFIQTLMELFDRNYNKETAKTSQKDTDTLPSKICTNLTVFLAHLYNFNVISSRLVVDLIQQSIRSLSEFDVELLLKMVVLSGYKLRSENPAALKEIIVQLQTRVAELEKLHQQQPDIHPPLSVRFRFMLEQIYALKNNRALSTKKHQQQGTSTADNLKKFLRNYLNKRQLPGCEALGCSLDDIRSVETKGKWWVVGAAWVGRQASASDLPTLQTNSGAQSATSADDERQTRLLKLAKKLNINTDIRRSIFLILMTAEDYADAFERLTKLQLRDKQEREIVRMLVYLAGQEQAYNPFYAVLGERLCRYSHHHKITFQFTFWDFFKTLEERQRDRRPPLRKVFHVADLMASLVGCHALSLTVLKTVDYPALGVPTSTSSEPTMTGLFLERVLLTLLLKYDEEAMKAVFERVAELDDVDVLRQGLVLVLSQWIRKRVGNEQSEVWSLVQSLLGEGMVRKLGKDKTVALVKARVKLAKEILVTGKHMRLDVD